MSDQVDTSFGGCNNPHCNCRYEGRFSWPLDARLDKIKEVEGETVGEAELASELEGNEGHYQDGKEDVLEQNSGMELNLNRKDDTLHQRLEEMAAGRRQHYSELPAMMLSSSAKKSTSDTDSDENIGGIKRVTSIAEFEDEAFFHQAFDETEVEKTYVVALATVNDIRETTGDSIKQQMRDYLQQVFDFPGEKVQELMRRAVNEQESPDLCLSITVLDATSLTAKDANGKSDPYCRLGILQEEHMDKSVVKHKDLVQWQGDGLLSDIVATSIKPATLEPVWNEDLELKIDDPKKEVLVLEVWDSDADEVQQTSHIKGIKGFGHFLSDLRKTDDFMGRCFYPVVSIPVTGEKKTFTLHSHSGKTKHGYISVHLSIRGVKKNTPVEVSIWEHTMLIRALVNSCSRQGNVYIRRWDGKLSPNAEQLLEQHALLNGLNELQLVAVRFSVLLKYHKLYAMSMSTINSLVGQIKEHRDLLPKDITPKDLAEGKGGRTLEWLAQLFSDLNELAENLEELFRNLLSLYNIGKTEELQRVKDSLNTLKDLYSFRPFVHQLPQEKAILKELLESCISEAIPSWFSILNAKLLPLTQTAVSDLQSVRDLAKESLSFSHKVLKTLDPLFMELGISYFSLFYVSLDSLLAKRLESTLSGFEASQEIAQTTFEVYTACRELVKLSQYVSPDKKEELSLSSSHMWFKSHVKSWMTLAISRCKDRILKAIELNETVTEKIKISTSAIDTVQFLIQVAEFWKNLDWPDPSVSYSMMVYMVQEMSDLAQFYVQQLYQARVDSYSTLRHFSASDDLCIDLNNMCHIRAQVRQLPGKLNLNSYYKWLEAEAKLGDSAKDIVDRVLCSADDDFENRMKHIVDDLATRMAPEIKKGVEASMTAIEDTPDLDAVAPLMDYLTGNLQTLVDSTYPEVFSCILYPIWTTCVEVFKKTLADLGSRKNVNMALAYQRLHVLLDTLTGFFYVGGQGLDLAVMQGQDFLEVKGELDFLKLSSDELTQHFFSDLVALQAEVDQSGEKKLGDLLVSLNYNTSKSAVDVHVIQSRGLPVMDKLGSSDPYVVLTLLPQWKFPDTHKKTFKTQVFKSTLDPYFDKDFLIPAKAEDAAVKGSVLLLTFYDHDIITSDDFMGMCVVPLHTLPGLPCASASSSRRLNQTLSLFRLSDTTKSRAATELAERAHKGDARATSFFKVNKKILGGQFEKFFKE